MVGRLYPLSPANKIYLVSCSLFPNRKIRKIHECQKLLAAERLAEIGYFVACKMSSPKYRMRIHRLFHLCLFLLLAFAFNAWADTPDWIWHDSKGAPVKTNEV